LHPAIYNELKRVAQRQDVTTYGRIAPLAGLDMGNPDHRNEIAIILGEISRHEHEHSRPLLSAVVILEGDSLPGKGFFTLARELELYESRTVPSPRKSSAVPQKVYRSTRYATSRNPRNGAAILAVPRLNLLCSDT